ncbi:PBECR3 domain-containing polyvalent protein [Clostridium tagluense]|uniref:PBECR3 domain-containing polyvalent protein n=1 Tax=Clostridium tagluense TaxID=360422 RepID=UPI001C6E61F6|nr:hypothetical protein [Clostridium tagluense]MBW9159495.1 hypothetical protein [Clostridium tagluense]WLC68491.1 hypothetical protein KTC93_25595 [Clostridium tagluense]
MVDLSSYTHIGTITETIANIKNFKYPGDVYAAPGILKHIQKHSEKFSEAILNDLLGTMKSILSNPDYVGCDPCEVGTSLELIKQIDDNILIALQFDIRENYIYVASLYPVTESKISNRLYSNRIVKL